MMCGHVSVSDNQTIEWDWGSINYMDGEVTTDGLKKVCLLSTFDIGAAERWPGGWKDP